MRTAPSSRGALALLISSALFCGVQAQGVPPAAQGGARQGGGRGNAAPVAYDDYTGYTKLWDGTTFANWDGETDVWSIQDGMIHADTTKTPGQHHIHYTGPGAVMRDFDLKVEVKISATGANGGIQYRSRLLHAAHGGSVQDPLGKKLPAGITTLAQAVTAGVTTGQSNPWQVSGYQFDMDSQNRYTGMLYEGQGRGIVMSPGTIVDLLPNRVTARLGTVTETPADLIKPHQGLAGEWQQIQIIARGNTLMHMINGKVISVIVDDSPADRAPQGIMSLQLEGSGQIWYRNVYVKTIN